MPQSFLPPGLRHFYRAVILTDRHNIFVGWSNVAQDKTTGLSPTLRWKSTLQKTVRCFFISHFSRAEVQFEGMYLSISDTFEALFYLCLVCLVTMAGPNVMSVWSAIYHLKKTNFAISWNTSFRGLNGPLFYHRCQFWNWQSARNKALSRS